MFRFVLRKMLNKKWMILALLIGNILMVSITGANAMYGQAVLQRTLTRNLAEQMTDNNTHPGTITIQSGGTAARNQLVHQTADIVNNIPQTFGIPAQQIVKQFYVGPIAMKTAADSEESMGTLILLGSMSDLEAHIELVAGRLYNKTPDADGVVDIMVSERGMVSLRLILDEIISVPRFTDPEGKPLRLRVCGVFRNNSEEDAYWVRSPGAFRQECFMAEEMFQQLFPRDFGEVKLSGRFDVLLDYTAMQADRVSFYLRATQEYSAYFEKLPSHSYEDTFSEILKNFSETAPKVEVTLWILQIPVFMLLAAFIFMVSQKTLEMERDEIAVLKSRGASKKQIILTYLLQSGILAALGVAIGVPVGVFLVQVLGSANAFLEFVQRAALPAKIDGRVLGFAAASGALCVAAMVLPVFGYADTTIVDHKQKKHRQTQTPLWQKLCLDFVVLAVSLYALYSYNSRKDILAQQVLEGQALDPLLYISSSLFMISAGLLVVRILPILTYGIFLLFKRWWSPSLYTAFLQVIRTRRSQNFIVVFLVVTIALGVFNAQAARTINANKEENIRYDIGADIVLREKWQNNSLQLKDDPKTQLVYEEPDFAKYETLEGVASATKVLRVYNATARVENGTIRNLQVMGIHTKSFGETAWLRDELLPHHFYEYLNAMAKHPGAVLLSRNFQTEHGYKIGDTISYSNADKEIARGYVCGFVDYWPGFQPITLSKGEDGVYKQTQEYLVVANLNQLQTDWGIQPYEVWLKAEDSTQFIYNFAKTQDLQFEKFEDASAQIVSMKKDPVIQGTNGILTVGFVVVLILCCVGFLIYWIVSIRVRQLQFGIYRAMGMTMRELVVMLLCEQVFVSGTSIAAGVGVGLLTSKLYMPLIQMGYAAYDNALPMQLISNPSDVTQLLIVTLSVIMVCMVILGWLLSKMKIAQVLKLGED